MGEIDYSDAAVPVRADITDSHQRAIDRIRAPGTWWTGEQRVAIAMEVRQAWSCGLCAQRRASSSIDVAGRHDSSADLSDQVIEAVHRITTDPGRLDEGWYRGLIAAGLTAEEYVELLGVVVTAVDLETFAAGVGARLFERPEPLGGDPTRIRPEVARDHGWWVPTIDPDEAGDRYADLFPGTVRSNVHCTLTLVPEESRGLRDLLTAQYLPYELVPVVTTNGGRTLSRSQMELVAARVSAKNDCFY